jgi:hypothetical protein
MMTATASPLLTITTVLWTFSQFLHRQRLVPATTICSEDLEEFFKAQFQFFGKNSIKISK